MKAQYEPVSRPLKQHLIKHKKTIPRTLYRTPTCYLLIILRPQLFRGKKFIKKKSKKYSVKRMVQLSDLSE